MEFYLTRRWGGCTKNPTEVELLQALEELATPDAEHPDTWLSDEDGWTLSVFEDGLVSFENVEGESEHSYRRQNVPREQAYLLWLLLQQNRVDDIIRLLSA